MTQFIRVSLLVIQRTSGLFVLAAVSMLIWQAEQRWVDGRSMSNTVLVLLGTGLALGVTASGIKSERWRARVQNGSIAYSVVVFALFVQSISER